MVSALAVGGVRRAWIIGVQAVTEQAGVALAGLLAMAILVALRRGSPSGALVWRVGRPHKSNR